MAWDTKPIIRTQGDPAPQAFDPTADIYKVVQSTNNAMWTVLKDEAGNFAGFTNGKLNIRASEIETILNTLATAANQSTIIGHVDGIETALATLNTAVSTAANQTTIIGHIDTLEALITTLNGYVDGLEGIMTAIRDTAGIKKITDAVTIGSSVLPTGAATAAKQDTIISAVDGVETTLSAINTAQATAANQVTIIGHIDGLEKATSNKYTRYSTEAKPTITNYQAGIEYTCLELDTGSVYVYDGTQWVVI